MKKVVLSFLAGVVTATLASLFIASQNKAHREPITVRVDTCIVYREKVVKTPVFVRNRAIPEICMVTIPIDSSIIANFRRQVDSLTIQLAREQREYSDSSYTAWVSGIDPRLDSIRFVIPEKVVKVDRIQKYKPKVTVGLQGGFGAVFPIKAAPTVGGYLGVGIQYNF